MCRESTIRGKEWNSSRNSTLRTIAWALDDLEPQNPGFLHVRSRSHAFFIRTGILPRAGQHRGQPANLSFGLAGARGSQALLSDCFVRANFFRLGAFLAERLRGFVAHHDNADTPVYRIGRVI